MNIISVLYFPSKKVFKHIATVFSGKGKHGTGWLVFFLFPFSAFCNESINPTISPALFRPGDEITVVYDVTGTPLANLTNAFAWVWIPGKNIDAKYNINPASNNAALTNNAKFVKSVEEGKTLFTLVFIPSEFFNANITTETRMGILLKGNDWSNGQTTDYLTDFWDGSFQIKLTSPVQQPLFVQTGENISIQAETPVAADFTLFINDAVVDEQDGMTTYGYTHEVTEVSGYSVVRLEATSGTNSQEVVFQYIISGSSPAQPRPAGIIAGINYHTDQTKVTLCLWAPGKSSAYVRGDFSGWLVLPENIMNRDGEFFWKEITGLTPATEYGFQYLVDESLFMGDPYADKILDPDDQHIPSTVYPSLKQYPQQALSDKWYFNRVAVLKTGQPAYDWQVTNFQKPPKENLVIYELLIRDFFANGQRSYKNLMDTVSYLKRLGVNAVELMPVMEYNGNEGWGYNPTFMFAPDKYYGPKDQLKAFVDKCHQEGIAVILDIAMNHHDIPNPYLMMDFDFAAFKPTVNNRWFNVDAKHPFNVFFDMNHESTYTKTYLDTVNYYWLKEYKIDGYRFDLSKGFTQTNNPSNVGAWSAYDASRINILKRMADKIWEHFPDAYVILEHFAANNEEKELAEYRYDEGKGMMMWGNLAHAYNQNTMGFSQDSDIAWVYHGTRGWNAPHVIGYMESHDEERNMYKNLQFGNVSGSYNVKTLATSLTRVKAAGVIFYTLPGPKMLWQFGEFGYDQSINRCDDGSINDNCRLTPKPVRWDYLSDYHRKGLFNHTADLIRLRNEYSVFTQGEAFLSGGTSLIKHITLKNNPYTSSPASADEMNVQIVVNFNLTPQNVIVEFPHTGTWYDYYAFGTPLVVNTTATVVALNPGEYKLFTDFQIDNPLITSVPVNEVSGRITAYPNPVENYLVIEADHDPVMHLTLRTLQGTSLIPQRLSQNRWDVQGLTAGLYIAEIRTTNGLFRLKLIKQ